MSTILDTSTQVLNTGTATTRHYFRTDTDSLHVTEFNPAEEAPKPWFALDYFPSDSTWIRVRELHDGKVTIAIGSAVIFLTPEQATNLAAKLAEVSA